MIPHETWLTQSAVRILNRLRDCDPAATPDTVAGQLVTACLEEQSLAGGILRDAGVSAEVVTSDNGGNPDLPQPALVDVADSAAVAQMMQALPASLWPIVAEARRVAGRDLQADGLSSEHLLAALLQIDTPVAQQLRQLGLTSELVLTAGAGSKSSTSAIPVTFTLDEEAASSGRGQTTAPARSVTGTGRVLDACLNRAREGLRVLEDYARFVLDDAELVRDLKDLRHRLAASERLLADVLRTEGGCDSAAVDRDVARDVGTGITGAQEQERHRLQDIVQANARRVQESLRSLEEFGKLISTEFAAGMKQQRYESYAIHQRLLVASMAGEDVDTDRRQRLQTARVCVLLTQSGCRQPWKQVVEACLAGGADIIQLREKQLDDRELLIRSRWIADACRAAGALAIVNDRPDIARRSGADGVHVGQQDTSVRDARRLLGPHRLIGLSTHSVSDMARAEFDGADYLGVGPVFPSVTKDFDQHAGVQLLREAVGCTVPWFAIGGIGPQNIGEVIHAGARRVAVSSAVIAADGPAQVTELLRERLTVDREETDC